MATLVRLIEEILDRRAIKAIITGVATEVTDTTCTLTRVDAPDLFGVRLNGIDDELESYATIVPKEGSEVLVGVVEGVKTEGVVLRCSEVEKVIWKCGDSRLTFDAGGYQIERGSENLKKLLSDILDAILQLTVTTSAGPSGTPINAAAFSQIKQRLNDLFS
jgi:hypothetical protein